MLNIGVHITQDSVCFAELSLERAKPKLHSVNEYFFDEQISQEEKNLFILRHLERIEKKNKGKALRFCYGLSQNVVTSFSVQFPFKEKFKILKTLPYEIEDKSPFNPDNVFFDARICRIQNENKASALCFVTPEENVNHFLEWSGGLKRPPYLLSCEAAALANLLEFWNKPLSQTQNPMTCSAYIYLGAQNSQILFYKDGHLIHISVLDWSVLDIVRKMEQQYKLKTEKAWEEFFVKSFILTEVKGFTQEQVHFSNLIKKQISFLVPKIKLLKTAIEAEEKIQIEEAVVFGPGAVIKNITAFLTAELSINISRLKSLAEISYIDPESQPSALIAFGLALEGLKSSPYQSVNFLQSMKKEDLSLFPAKWLKLGLASLLCFVVLTAYAFFRKQESFKILERMESIFIEYGKNIASLQANRISVESLQSFLEKEKSETDNEKFVQAKLDFPNPMDHLRLISKKLNSAEKWKLKIDYLKIENEIVEIKGWVEKTSLGSFKSELKSLSKSSIQDNSSSHNPLLNKKESLVDKKQLLEGENKTEHSKSQKEGDMVENKETKFSESEADLEQKDQVFFSYSFKIKEEL